MTLYDVGKGICAALLCTIWRLRVRGAENVPREGPLIVACNHISYFDPPALGVALPRPISYMAKAELFEIPVLGPIIARVNAFPVDRTRGDRAAIKKAVEIIESGAALGIFPEGTRNKTGDVKPQIGVALLASLTQAPVLPAYVSGTDRANRFARIEVVFGKPFVPGGGQKATREDLANWTDEVMARIRALRETL